jgi:leader peptidase (prepilin peptidase) / N-methyltransferase
LPPVYLTGRLSMKVTAQWAINAGTYAIPVVFALAALPALRELSSRPLVAALSVVLVAVLIAASVIDWRSFILPDRLTLPLILAGPIVTLMVGSGNLVWSLVSAAIGYGLLYGVNWLYREARGRDGIGMGDAKLLAAAGAWLGAGAIPTVLLWGAALALCSIAFSAPETEPPDASRRLPFGPALAMGFWLTWLYGAIS